MSKAIKVTELNIGDRVRVRLGRESSWVEGVITYDGHGKTYLRYSVPVSPYAPDGIGKLRVSHRHRIERIS